MALSPEFLLTETVQTQYEGFSFNWRCLLISILDRLSLILWLVGAVDVRPSSWLVAQSDCTLLWHLLPR